MKKIEIKNSKCIDKARRRIKILNIQIEKTKRHDLNISPISNIKKLNLLNYF